jgi:NAD(P)-dependent dehydrogenase (short-subunit alcohol dehydrogenase family)
MTDIDGRVAVVTGGASGIGLGIAKRLVAAGARVALADLRPDHLEAALNWFAERQASRQVHGVLLDVTSRARLAEVAEEIDQTLGPVSILVNNAGVGIEGPLREATYADWDFGMGVNLGGVINGLQTFLPRIIRHGRGGHVVNTASMAAITPMPSWMAIYGAAKAAVVSLSEALVDDLARDAIGVSILMPGPVKSNIHQLSQNVAGGYQPGAAFAASAQRLGQRQVSDLWMEPEQVGDMVVDAIRANQLYIITHGEWRDIIRERHARIEAAIPAATNPDLIASLRTPRAVTDQVE